MTLDLETFHNLDQEHKYSVPGTLQLPYPIELENSALEPESPRVPLRRHQEMPYEGNYVFKSPLPTEYPMNLSPPPTPRRPIRNLHTEDVPTEEINCDKTLRIDERSLSLLILQRNCFDRQARDNKSQDAIYWENKMNKKSQCILKPRFENDFTTEYFQPVKKVNVLGNEIDFPKLPNLFPEDVKDSEMKLKPQVNFMNKFYNSNAVPMAHVIPTKSGFPKRAPSA